MTDARGGARGDEGDRETWLAPGKINLWLAVGGRRPDGMHEVDTCYQAIDVADRIEIARAPSLADVICRVTGEFAHEVPEGDGNLAARAARLLAARTGHDLQVSIAIEKRIPAGAGLGGASSDAAAVLLALGRRFAVPDPEHTLGELAAELGADVPFFLEGGTRRARGIGDELAPAEPPAERWGVLAWPGVGVPTGEAYGWLDAARGEAGVRSLPPEGGGGRGNDFEPVVSARVPKAGSALDVLAAGPARSVRMSGSGSASFALYASEAERDRDLPRVRASLAEIPGARIWPFACVGYGVHPEPGVCPAARAGR
ncbi:MAG TPA: 4-(cytidine 5'-diphospho)-2-C-methyl-D-erythritol kinase [Gemmatimonadota bacterium]|nr:4-(cytidine 5'-diphospho)-2-C-methyl-D-erythritol kinase [Gemmatimonadota bacterium]